MAAPTCLQGLQPIRVTGPAPGMLHMGRGGASSLILGMMQDSVTHQPTPRQSRQLLLSIPSQKLGTCPGEQVKDMALGVDNGKSKEVVVSTGCSEALPATLHTQGGEPKPGLELVAPAPA